MSDMPRVRIVNVAKAPGVIHGWHTKVYVDDVDISRAVAGVVVHANPKEWLRATLDVVVNSVEFDGELLTDVASATRDLLISQGWTPPVDEGRLASEVDFVRLQTKGSA